MNDALLTCLTEERQTAADFADLLAEEQAALMSGILLEILPAIVERKAALASKLAELAQQRGDCLETLGHANDRPGILAAIRQDARLAPVWKDLSRSAASARSLNLTNGMLLRTRMEYNQRALAVLREASGSRPASSMYGPDGRLSSAYAR
jgi:flagellar biosynthesis protein FlgN